MLQKIINYEYTVLQKKQSFDIPISNIIAPPRYCSWKFYDSLQKIPQYQEYNIFWMGNDKNAPIVIFVYCIILGTFHISALKDEMLTRLKYKLYQFASSCLSIVQQKLLVQNICLMQYSNNIGQYLQKNAILQNLLVKIFTFIKQKSFYYQNIDVEQQHFQQIKVYSRVFDFAIFVFVDPKIGKLTINNAMFYIINENQCFFLLQNRYLNFKQKVQLDDSTTYQTVQKNSKKKNQRKAENSSQQNGISIFSPQYSTPKFYLSKNRKEEKSSPKINIQAFKEYSESSEKVKNSVQKNYNFADDLVDNFRRDRILTEQTTYKKKEDTLNKTNASPQPFMKMKNKKLNHSPSTLFNLIKLKNVRNTVPELNKQRRSVPQFILQKKRTTRNQREKKKNSPKYFPLNRKNFRVSVQNNTFILPNSHFISYYNK